MNNCELIWDAGNSYIQESACTFSKLIELSFESVQSACQLRVAIWIVFLSLIANDADCAICLRESNDVKAKLITLHVQIYILPKQPNGNHVTVNDNKRVDASAINSNVSQSVA